MSKIKVTCEAGCTEVQYISKRAYTKNVSRNGVYRCFDCSRRTYVGSGNPNSKYDLDTSYFNEIVEEDQAYILGLIASDGSVTPNTINIALRDYDQRLLNNVKDRLYGKSKPSIVPKATNMFSLSINSKEISMAVCALLGIEPRKKSDIVKFPDFKDDQLKWAFIRGYFDGDGHVRPTYGVKKITPHCSISSNSTYMLTSIQEFCDEQGIKSTVGNNYISWDGLSALDFLSKIYDDASLYLSRKRDTYLDWVNWSPAVSHSRSKLNLGEEDLSILFLKTDKNAVIPQKARASDAGYDLTVIKAAKSYGPYTLYSTGIKCSVPLGFYFDLVPRSSLHKSGYTIANNIGIIDASYRGEIFIPMVKLDKNAAELELPMRAAQLILRRSYHLPCVEVSEFTDTSNRGEGGFGSTGR